MFRRFSFAAMAWLSFSVPTLAGDTLESVEKKISELADKVKSMSADIKSESVMDSDMMKNVSTGTGTHEYMRKGDKVLFRMEMKMATTMKLAGTETKTEQTSLSIADGDFIYTLSDNSGVKNAMKMKQTADMAKVADKSMIEELRKDNDLKLLPDETVDGKPAWVIQATPKDKKNTGTMTYWFGKDSGTILRTKMVSNQAGSKMSVETSYRNVKINPDLKADRFVFKAPPGVQIIDMTQGIPGMGAAGEKKDEGKK